MHDCIDGELLLMDGGMHVGKVKKTRRKCYQDTTQNTCSNSPREKAQTSRGISPPFCSGDDAHPDRRI